MLTSGAWDALKAVDVRPGRYGVPVGAGDVDVERYNQGRREAKIRRIVFELTHRPVLVKVRERTFGEDVERLLVERL